MYRANTIHHLHQICFCGPEGLGIVVTIIACFLYNRLALPNEVENYPRYLWKTRVNSYYFENSSKKFKDRTLRNYNLFSML